jgi:hypothetical protein
MEPIRKPSFILWMWGGLLLWMGCSWWWEYSHQGYIRVFTKDGHGGYLRYEGSLAIALFGVCLAVVGAANPAIASRLQSTRPVRRVAGSFDICALALMLHESRWATADISSGPKNVPGDAIC